MELSIKEIKEKQVWENFLSDCKEKTFLNSWNWGEFQKLMGNKIWRLGIFEKENLISLALAIKVSAKRGTFLFLPHGPNLKPEKSNLKFEVLKVLVEKLKEIAKIEKCHFIRISPIWERKKENSELFRNLGFLQAPIHIHPEVTWELDISQPKEKLLMEMRKTTRYLIKRAQKDKDIEIFEKNDLEGVEIFNQIYQITKERHRFVPFPLSYLKNEFLAFSKENQISIILGKYKGEVVSGGIFVFWQKIGFYHHGASSQKYPKVPVSYLLIWKAIEKAKSLGFEKFNFWGIAETKSKNHPWAGLSFFKMGFGGEKKEYVKTQDFPLSFRYWINYLIERARKIKRGY